MSAYYGAIIANTKRVKAVTPVMRHLHKFLQRRAASQQGSRPAQALTADQMRQIWKVGRLAKTNSETQHAATAIVFSWLWGQRISDAMKIRRKWITKVTLGVTNTKQFLAICQRAGKVIGTLGPYTNHVPIDHPVGQWIENQLLQSNGGLLFKAPNQMINQLLRALPDPVTDRRAIRRGGLQDMASKGVDLETIRQSFSKHQSTKSLHGYLNNGAMVLSEAILHSDISRRVHL
jgi:hypothetical protein